MAKYARLLLLFILSSCSLRHTETAVATVIHPGGGGKPSIIEFRAGGKRQVAFGPRQRYLTKGELFPLTYSKGKPWKYQLLTESPLFLPGETTGYTEGKVLRCVSGDYSKVIFSYEVNGKVFKKLQVIKGPVGLGRSEYCVVQFCPENPLRSILVAKQSYEYLCSLALAAL